MKIRFETNRLIVRDIQPDDLHALLQVYTDRETMKYVSDGNYSWTLEQLSEKYEKLNRKLEAGWGIFAVIDKTSNKLIGEAGLFDSFDSRHKLEVGYIINRSHWNKGYASEICMGLINYCFDKLKTESLIARMYAENVPSVKLSEKCGMQRIKADRTGKGEAFYVYEIRNPLFIY